MQQPTWSAKHRIPIASPSSIGAWSVYKYSSNAKKFSWLTSGISIWSTKHYCTFWRIQSHFYKTSILFWKETFCLRSSTWLYLIVRWRSLPEVAAKHRCHDVTACWQHNLMGVNFLSLDIEYDISELWSIHEHTLQLCTRLVIEKRPWTSIIAKISGACTIVCLLDINARMTCKYIHYKKVRK